MDRRNFLKQASGYALAAAGTMTGIGQVFASAMPAKEDRTNGYSDNLKQNKDMEHRNLGGMEVSAIGLGCLPMVGYYVRHRSGLSADGGLLRRQIREEGYDSPYPPGIRPRCHAVRHGGGVRTLHQRGMGRRSEKALPRHSSP